MGAAAHHCPDSMPITEVEVAAAVAMAAVIESASKGAPPLERESNWIINPKLVKLEIFNLKMT